MLHGDWLARRASWHPERPAVVVPDAPERSLDYRGLDEAAWRSASLLRECSIRPGDRVAVLAGNRVETLALFFACARMGAILVPLNWRLAPSELAVIVEDCAPSLLLVDTAHAATAEILRAGGACACPVLHLDPVGGEGTWGERLAAHAATTLDPAQVSEDTPALILYTSGSTGRPKGAVLTHGSITWNAVNTRIGWGLGEHEVTLAHTPLFHTGGWNVLTLPLLHGGGTVLLTAAFDPEATLDLVEQHGVTVLFAVPTMYADLLSAQRARPRDLTSLRMTISGGASCPLPLIEAFTALGAPLKQGYGLTEVGPNCFVFPGGQEAARAGTVGLPMPHLQLRLVDEAGAPVPDGVVGELQLRGPTVCAGYWNNPEATAAALSEDGWFSTGDLFRRDADGWYAVVGRRKEMFISGGENVYPAEVERVLYALPGVVEAAVVPAPHDRWGEVGHAFLAWAPGSAPLDTDAVRALCREQLAGYKVPKHVTTLPELPKGATGKIARAALADRARA